MDADQQRGGSRRLVSEKLSVGVGVAGKDTEQHHSIGLKGYNLGDRWVGILVADQEVLAVMKLSAAGEILEMGMGEAVGVDAMEIDPKFPSTRASSLPDRNLIANISTGPGWALPTRGNSPDASAWYHRGQAGRRRSEVEVPSRSAGSQRFEDGRLSCVGCAVTQHAQLGVGRTEAETARPNFVDRGSSPIAQRTRMCARLRLYRLRWV